MTDAERMDIARGAASSVAPRAQSADFDDMTQDALVAIWKAEETWDGRGKLSARCFAKARWAIIDGIRDRGQWRRVGRPDSVLSLDYEYNDLSEDGRALTMVGVLEASSPDPERAAIAKDDASHLDEWLAEVDPRGAEAVLARVNGGTMTAVAERHNLTVSRVSQIHTETMTHLRRRFAA